VTIRAHYRRDLALAQLQTALRLYFDAGHHASVITLAGAAEEIFGKLVTASGGDNSLDSIKRAVSEIHKKLYGEPLEDKHIRNRANAARNSLKHWDEGDTEIIKFDLEQEAHDMLHRAIDKYWLLEQKLTHEMERFLRNRST
jgi:hypothetical protein